MNITGRLLLVLIVATGVVLALIHFWTLTQIPTQTPTIPKDSDGDGLLDEVELGNGLDPFQPNPNVAYLYNITQDINFAKTYGLSLDKDGVMDLNEKEFNDKLVESKLFIDNEATTFANYLLNFTKDGEINDIELERANNALSLIKELYEITRNENISVNKFKDADYGFSLAIRLSFEDKLPTREGIFAIANYAIAVRNSNLPEEFNSLQLLVQATETEKGKDLVDFRPIILTDRYGNTVEIFKDPNIPEEVWMLTKFLGKNYYLLNCPETWFTVNAKIRQNYVDIFYRLSIIPDYAEKRSLTDSEAWDVIIEQWNYYWLSSPQTGNVTQRIVFFPFYDSRIQEEWIPNEIDRKIANFVFWQLPLVYWKKDGTFLTGVNGMKEFLREMEESYYKVLNDYLTKGWDMRYPDDPYALTIKKWYGQWLFDRWYFGMKYTVEEWIGAAYGLYGKTYEDAWIIAVDPNRNGADNILQRWEYGDFIKWLLAYNRACADGSKSINEFLNIGNHFNRNFRAFGIPFIAESNFFEHWIGNSGQTAYGYEPAIFGLPQSLINQLSDKAIILPGNGLAFLSSPYGLQRDIELGRLYKYVQPYLAYARVVLILNPEHWYRSYHEGWIKRNIYYGINLSARE